MIKEARWQQRLADFQQAYQRLAEALKKTDFVDLEKDGVIQRFEFTFELAWKTLKDYLSDQGFSDVVSPKKAIQVAFENNLIKNGDIWIEMLEDRNRMSHMYDQKISENIFQNIQQKYRSAFEDLITKLK